MFVYLLKKYLATDVSPWWFFCCCFLFFLLLPSHKCFFVCQKQKTAIRVSAPKRKQTLRNIHSLLSLYNRLSNKRLDRTFKQRNWMVYEKSIAFAFLLKIWQIWWLFWLLWGMRYFKSILQIQKCWAYKFVSADCFWVWWWNLKAHQGW